MKSAIALLALPALGAAAAVSWRPRPFDPIEGVCTFGGSQGADGQMKIFEFVRCMEACAVSVTAAESCVGCDECLTQYRLTKLSSRQRDNTPITPKSRPATPYSTKTFSSPNSAVESPGAEPLVPAEQGDAVAAPDLSENLI
ncbi:hypothetical protein RJ55_04846 [Drechmeria coniospora]|nr:hypothetical protein RJ55_04846 [Drechmeria coniospora]